MKLIKWVLWLVLFVVVVAAGGAVFLVTTVDPNDLKPQISQKVESVTGRKLELKGDLSWRFYPWVGVTLNDFSLSNREGFMPEKMLQAEYVDVQLKLLPLLSKQIEVGNIKLQAPVINLSVNEAGETNWGDLAGAADGSNASNASVTGTPEGDAGAMVGGLVIQGVDISKGEIDWNNAQAGQKYHLSNFELSTDEIQPQTPISFDLKTKLTGTDIPNSAQINLNGAISVSDAFDAIQLAFLNVEADMDDTAAKVDIDTLSFVVSTGELLAKQIKADVKIPGITANMAMNSISFSTESNQALLERVVGAVEMEGIKADVDVEKLRYAVDSALLAIKAIKYSATHELGQVDGVANTLAFDVNKNTLSLAENSIKGKLEDLPIESVLENLQLNLDAETLSIPKIVIRSDEAQLQVSVEATQIMGDIQASGQLSSNTLNPRVMLEKLALGSLLADLPPTAVQAVQIKTDFKGGLNAASLDNLNLVLDQSTLTGNLSVSEFDREIPSARFDLELDKINVDQYLAADSNTATSDDPVVAATPAAAKADTPATQAGQPSAAPAMAAGDLPYAMLKGIDIKGRIGIGELRVDNLSSNDVVVKVDTANDRIEISPLRASAYGGETVNTVVYDISGDQPVVQLQSKLTTLNLGRFLTDLKVTDRLEGFGGMSADLNSTGINSADMIAALNGTIDIELNDGAISGVSLQDALLKVESLYKQLKGKDLELQGEVSDKTEFSSFVAHIVAENGVLKARDVNLMAPAIRVTGGGDVDLNTEQLNLKLMVSVVASFEGQGGQTLEKLKGLTIPIAITGSFDSPSVRPDLGDLAKQQLQKELSKKYLGTEVSGQNFEAALGAKLTESLNKELGIEPEPAATEDAGKSSAAEAPAKKKPVEDKRSTEDQLKDQLKNTLMKSLFGG